MPVQLTPECEACVERGRQQIAEIAKLLAESFPDAQLDVKIMENLDSFAVIGRIALNLGTNRFDLKFVGVGGTPWSTMLANWMRYKVDINSYGYPRSTYVFEKVGKLNIQKILTVVKKRHQEYVERQENEDLAKVNREI